MMQTIVIYAAFALGIIANVIHFARRRKPSSKALQEADKVAQEVEGAMPQVEAALGVAKPAA